MHRRAPWILAVLSGLTIGTVPVPSSAAASEPHARAPRCATPSPPPPATYTVAGGDSWYGIAAAAGVTAGALLVANGVAATAILHPGDVLCLPAGAAAPADGEDGGAACTATRRVVDGDSWYGIAHAVGASLGALLEANGATTTTVLHPGTDICVPPGSDATPPAPACASTYTVAAGDSWFGIALAAGIRTAALLSANEATTATVLRPGDELCLPAGSAPADDASACASKRTVGDGDSWYSISRSTGVPMPALYAANDATSTTILFAGDELCLPAVGFGRALSAAFIDAPPVRGACRFANSWSSPRSGGRRHEGVDLIAAAGTPVAAAADGVLSRQVHDHAGRLSGNAWYLTTSSGTYFFYAHLSGFAPGLQVGSRVRAGDVIGYVGSTGNATSPHLHLEIHPYGGGAINPYDSVWMVGGCEFDRRYEQSALW